MKRNGPGNAQGLSEESLEQGFSPTELILGPSRQQKTKKRNFMDWWLDLTGPPDADLSAGFEKRDLVRRGRLTSYILFAICCLDLGLGFPIGLLTSNKILILISVGELINVALCAVLNRRGATNIAGVLTVIGADLTVMSIIFSDPKGLEAASIPLFCILAYTEIVAVMLLPTNWIWFFTALNIAYCLIDPRFQLKDPQFAPILATQYFPMFGRIVALHAIISFMVWLVVLNLRAALRRADRAEVIANLEHQMARQGEEVKEQKRQLDESIQLIVDVHRKVGNGDLQARVPLDRGHVLWQIAGSLNNLISRLQRYVQDSYQLNRTERAIGSFFEARSQANGNMISWQPTNTPVDRLVQQHNFQVQQAQRYAQQDQSDRTTR